MGIVLARPPPFSKSSTTPCPLWLILLSDPTRPLNMNPDPQSLVLLLTALLSTVLAEVFLFLLYPELSKFVEPPVCVAESTASCW